MDVEALSQKAHAAWRAHKISLGVADHPYKDTGAVVPGGMIFWCGVCGQIPNVPRHLPEMAPWGELSETQKESFRVIVGTVMECAETMTGSMKRMTDTNETQVSQPQPSTTSEHG